MKGIHAKRTLAAAAAAGVFLALALEAQAQTAIRRDAPMQYVNVENADQILKPGDIMMKRLSDASPATTIGISISESFIQNLHGTLGSSDASAGDPQVVHAAIYVGKGETAEAHGSTTGESAGVGLRRLSKHAGYIWYVYRPQDAALGAEAAAIARTWATGRMGYALPFSVPFSDSSFGPRARSEALEYARAANVAGGPPGMDKMFCSQFVLAAYQAAYVTRLLKAKPALRADEITMYPGVDKQPSNTSPLVMHGHFSSLRLDTGGWTRLGFVVTQLPPPNPFTAAPQLPLGGGPLTLKGAGGRCLDAAHHPLLHRAVKGQPVILWDCNGGANQKWRAKDGLLMNEDMQLCLSVDNGRLALTQRLVVWDCHGGADQKWAFKDGMVSLGTTGFCADAGFGKAQANGTPVSLGHCAKTPSTSWARAL